MAVHHPPRDASVGRHGLHEHLQALTLLHARDGGHGAEVRSAEVERDVADGEPAGGFKIIPVERGSLLHPRRRGRVRREHELRGEERVRLAEPFLERAVGVAHQPLARSDVQRDGRLPDVHPSLRHPLVRHPLHLRAPLARGVRDADTAAGDLLRLVRHRHDHRLLQVRPVDVHAAVDQVRVGRGAV